MRSLVSIALPVYNGATTLTRTVESVLAQSHANLELVISDNASTDGTREICKQLAGQDRRVVYQRHDTNIGVTRNFISAANRATGTYLRWIGDDDSLAPDYLSRTLEKFAEDECRVLVTTQMAYTDPLGAETLDTSYVPEALSSVDPVVRFSEMLRLLTSGFALLDPIYGVIRRDVATMPRRNILREDEVFAARLALAGPWGHVDSPLAHRHRSEPTAAGLTRLLGVAGWRRHVIDVLQCRELLAWIDVSGLDPAQRRRARAAVVRLYGRRKRIKVRRGVAKLGRMTGHSVSLRASEAR